jgi:hypothetical protein
MMQRNQHWTMQQDKVYWNIYSITLVLINRKFAPCHNSNHTKNYSAVYLIQMYRDSHRTKLHVIPVYKFSPAIAHSPMRQSQYKIWRSNPPKLGPRPNLLRRNPTPRYLARFRASNGRNGADLPPLRHGIRESGIPGGAARRREERGRFIEKGRRGLGRGARHYLGGRGRPRGGRRGRRGRSGQP